MKWSQIKKKAYNNIKKNNINNINNIKKKKEL